MAAALGMWLGAWAPASALPELPAAGKPAPVYSLQNCLELGLARNAEILKAEQDIQRSQGVIITAKSVLYPRLSLSGRIEERNDDLFSEGNNERLQRFRDYWTVSLVASQSLYSGGANRQQIAIAKLQNTTAVLQLRVVANQTLRAIRLAVYDIVVSEAQINAQLQTVRLLEQELVRQQQYFEAGKTTRFNVLRTQVSLSNQNVQLTQARVQRTTALTTLTQLLNIPWKTEDNNQAPFLIREELDCPPMNEPLPELIALALSRRPEAESLRHQIEIAERQIKVDQAANIPRVDAFAGYEVRRDQDRSSFGDQVNAGTVGLLGSWNIFDGFAGRGRVVSGKAALNSVRISEQSARLKIENEVRDAYERLKGAEISVRAQGENTKTAEDSLRLAQNSADAGYATLLDVLQATLDLTTSRLEAIRARQRYMKSLADLEYAISLQFRDGIAPEGAAVSSVPVGEGGR
jgi:outer membrane protein